MYSLEQSFTKEELYLERHFLGNTKVALLFLHAPSKYFYWLCRLKGIKTILRIDGFYCPEQFNNVMADSIYAQTRLLSEERIKLNYDMQIAILKSDWVIYQSQFCKDMLDKFLFNRLDNFSIVYNGVDLSHFEANDTYNPFSLVIFGTLRDVDLFNCMLKSFSSVYAQDNRYSLVVAGSMTKEVEVAFSQYLESDPSGENAQYIGKLDYDQIPRVISSHGILLHLKSGDWCPNAVLEAMACGLPIVCQRYGGTSELVGDAGIIIDHPSYSYDSDLVKKVADAVASIQVNHPSYRNLAIERANKFSIDQSAKQYASILRGN